jgi:hypothetical protein
MEEKVQQRVCIDFCFRLEKTGAETYEMQHEVGIVLGSLTEVSAN